MTNELFLNTAYENFERGFALAEIGEYIAGNSFATEIDLPKGVTIRTAIACDIEVIITQRDTTVFQATESYNREFEVLAYEAGSWIEVLNRAYNEFVSR